MKPSIPRRALVLALAALGTAGAARAQSATDIAQAKTEGIVVIYSATDQKQVAPLLRDFEAAYPGVKVEYHDMNSTELYNRFISESAAGASADVLWSSAMDLQVKLVNDGYAMTYKLTDSSKLPDWSIWKNEAYGTTYEPVGIVYNKRLVDAADVPRTHGDFTKLLTTKLDKYKGKVTTFDPEKSGVGFNFHSQDALTNPTGFWELAKAMGQTGVRVQSSTGTMMERIASGENLIGYNLIGSYALTRAAKDPSIGVVFPSDYTLVMSRVMFIAKGAKHPAASKVFLEYILSQRGQKVIASDADLFAIRSDVTGDTTASGLQAQLGNALKPIVIGPGLLTYLDQAKRLEFLKQWNAVKSPK
ncbi:ABC transporter substrate-binding protein [Derxia gummosa]|uniref:ABC transporter substrate-binding protein n=1 Tax=Derxia gummosa DSM 723 TaxID=1121388 RepID=A0A8B6X5S6_9BURK|nr:ABC transporter substrate-binding protein [Derxia gummosa]